MTVATKINFFPHISHNRSYNHNYNNDNRKRWGQDKHRETSYDKNNRSKDLDSNPDFGEKSMRPITFSHRNKYSQIHRNPARKRPFFVADNKDRSNRYENNDKNNHENGQRFENQTSSFDQNYKSANKSKPFHQQKKSDYDRNSDNLNYNDRWKNERRKSYRSYHEDDDYEYDKHPEFIRSKSANRFEEKGRCQWKDRNDEGRDMKRSETTHFKGQCKDKSTDFENFRQPWLKKNKFHDAIASQKVNPLNQNTSLSTPRIARHNKIQKTNHTHTFKSSYSTQLPVKFRPYKNKNRPSYLEAPVSKYMERRNKDFRDHYVRNHFRGRDDSFQTQSNIVSSSSSSLPRSLPSPSHSTSASIPGGSRFISRLENTSHPSHNDTIKDSGDSNCALETKLYPEHKVTPSSLHTHLQSAPKRELEEGEEDEEEEGEIVNEHDEKTFPASNYIHHNGTQDQIFELQRNNDPTNILRKDTKSIPDEFDNLLNQSIKNIPPRASSFQSRWEPAPGSNYSQAVPYSKKSCDASKVINGDIYTVSLPKSTVTESMSEKEKQIKVIENSPTICSIDSSGEDYSKTEENCKNMKDEVLSNVQKNESHKIDGHVFADEVSDASTIERTSIKNVRKEDSTSDKNSKSFDSNIDNMIKFSKNMLNQEPNIYEESKEIQKTNYKRLLNAEDIENKEQAYIENDAVRVLIENNGNKNMLDSLQEKEKVSTSVADTIKYEESEYVEDQSIQESMKSFNVNTEQVKENKEILQTSVIVDDSLCLKGTFMDVAPIEIKEKSNRKKPKLRITISKQKLKASSRLPSPETNSILFPVSEPISCTENPSSSASVSQSDSSILSRTKPAREAKNCPPNVPGVELIDDVNMKGKQCIKHDIDITSRHSSCTSYSLSDRIVDEDDTSLNTSPSLVNTTNVHDRIISQVSPISSSSSKSLKNPMQSSIDNTGIAVLRSKEANINQIKPVRALISEINNTRKSASLPKKKRFMAAMQEQVNRSKLFESFEQNIIPNTEGAVNSKVKKANEKCTSVASNEIPQIQVQPNRITRVFGQVKHTDRNPFLSSSSSSSSSSSDSISSSSEEDMEYSDDSSCALSEMSDEEEDSLDEKFTQGRNIHSEKKAISGEQNASSKIKSKSEDTLKPVKAPSNSFQNRLNAMVLSSFHSQEDELNKKMKSANMDVLQEDEKQREINMHKKYSNASSQISKGESGKNKTMYKAVRYKKIKRNICKPDLEDNLPTLKSKKNQKIRSQVPTFANPRFKITTNHELSDRSKLQSRKRTITQAARGDKIRKQRTGIDSFSRFKMLQSKSNVEVIPRFKLPLPSKESTIIPRFKLPPQGKNKTTSVNKRQKIKEVTKLKKETIARKKKRDSSDEDDSYTTDENTNNHWVRRSVRTPCKSVLRNRHVKMLLMKLRNNDADMQVLKLKKYIGPDTPTIAMDAILDRLMENSNCQALYIQNFNEGMRDAQMLKLVKVLKQVKNIWCINIGETYHVKPRTWEKFARGLKKTNITHMYASEHTISSELKIKMRDIIRINRKKHNRHIDPDNLDIIIQCTHCWWNPINAKSLRPHLQAAGKEHLLFDRETLGLPPLDMEKNSVINPVT